MKKLVLAYAVAGLAFPAIAQEAPNFSTVDADANGSVSAEEMKAAMPDMTDDQWNTADADKSGSLTKQEFEAMIKSGM